MTRSKNRKAKAKTPTVAAGVVGITIFLILLIVGLWFLGAMLWGWIIMLVVGALKPKWGWGYWDPSVLPWGVVTMLALGLLRSILGGNKSTT